MKMKVKRKQAVMLGLIAVFAVLLAISLPGVLYFMKQKKNLWDDMEVGN